MSNVFEGPGYWMASDGKWYPPERHPDSGYRERFTAAPPVSPTLPEPEVITPPAIPTNDEVAVGDEVEVDEVEVDGVEQSGAPEFPSVELHRDESPAVSTPLADIHRTGGEAGIGAAPIVDDERGEETSDQIAPSFSVASNDFGSASERPVFDSTPPASITAPPGGAAASSVEVGHGTVELEIDRQPPASVRQTPLRPSSGPALSASTALAVIPAVQEPLGGGVVDRFLAAVLFCAGVAMIVGTFLDWTAGSLVQTGWDRGDGIATIIAGILGSAAAGPMYVGFNHIVPKAVAIVAGLVGFVVVSLTAVSVLFDSDTADTSLAAGFFIVLVGAAAMIAGGLAHRIDQLH